MHVPDRLKGALAASGALWLTALSPGVNSATAGSASPPPNCIFCHRFYQMAEPLVRAGRLQLRWAIVGFLRPTGAARAAVILASSNPVQALQMNEAHFDVGAEEGGIPPARRIDGKLEALLESHLAAMQSVGGSGTPTLLYRTDATHWAARIGLPPAAWVSAYAAGKPFAVRGDRQ